MSTEINGSNGGIGAPLVLHCWEGYEARHVLDPFRHRFNADVVAETLVSDHAAATACVEHPDARPDVLNINNAYVSGFLHPQGAVTALEGAPFDQADVDLHPDFAHLGHWAHSRDKTKRIGVAQRFGAFNLVVDTAKISRGSAEDQGFNLAADPAYHKRYGVLLFEDFNIFHICIAAGVNPFIALSPAAIDAFTTTAIDWFRQAALVSEDHAVLNRALVAGEIDFYLSGGTYTASPVRLEGHTRIRAVTPRRGPVNGQGGIVFTEVTCLLDKSTTHPAARRFLEYLLEPESAYRAAITQRSSNPVLQMGNTELFGRFSRAELDAIQWDSLAEDVSRCAQYELVPDHDRLKAILDRARSAD